MAKITIGRVEYTVPEFNFAAVERAWPYIEEATLTQDPMLGPAAGLRIIAAGLLEDDKFDKTTFGMNAEDMLSEDEMFDRVTQFLKRKLLAKEIILVKQCVDDILEEAGLTGDEADAGKGEAAPTETPSPSAETAASSSQSSSQPDAKEEAGTA